MLFPLPIIDIICCSLDSFLSNSSELSCQFSLKPSSFLDFFPQKPAQWCCLQEKETASSSILPALGFCLQQSKFINPKDDENWREQKKKGGRRKEAQKRVKAVWSFVLFVFEDWVVEEKREINYGAHLNMISSTRPLPVPWKTKLLSKLIACCSRSGIKENNQAGLD